MPSEIIETVELMRSIMTAIHYPFPDASGRIRCLAGSISRSSTPPPKKPPSMRSGKMVCRPDHRRP